VTYTTTVEKKTKAFEFKDDKLKQATFNQFSEWIRFTALATSDTVYIYDRTTEKIVFEKTFAG
jgi:hypothetical protein